MKRTLRRRYRLVGCCLLLLTLPWIWNARTFFLGAEPVAKSWRMLVPGSRSISMVDIPEGTYWLGSVEGERGAGEDLRKEWVDGFSIAQHELRVRDFVAFLNAGWPHYEDTEQIVYRRGRFQARRGLENMPMAYVTFEEASAYCVWLSELAERSVRLPTESEWEVAARGGLQGALFPVGWRAPASKPLERVDAVGEVVNGYGLSAMAGSVYEWCIPSLEEAPMGVGRGGSYAERDARLLMVHRREPFPLNYRDRDVGFRVVVTEIASESEVETAY